MKTYILFFLLVFSVPLCAQWNLMPSNAFGNDTTYQPKFYFINKDVGFCIVGRNANDLGSNRHNALYKTINGANSWSRLNSHLIAQAEYGIDGFGKDTIIVGLGNNRVIRSVNEGLSWDTISFIGGNPICFPGGHVILIGDTSIWKSNDYGLTWSHVINSVFFRSFIQFTSKDTGYYINNINPPMIKATNDGGKTWSDRYSFPFSLGASDYALFAASSKVVFLMANEKLMKSIDGGNSWSEIKNLGGKVNNSNDGLYFINEKDGFYSFRGQFYKTNDTGKTWCLQTPSINGSDFISQWTNVMHFENDSLGIWANGGSPTGMTVMTTTNQGGPPCPSDTTIKGLGAEQGFNQLKVYPNPSSGLLTLTLEQGQLSQMQLFSMEGRLVFSQKLSEQEVTLQLPAMSPGIYMLEVQSTANKVFRQKLVME